MARREGAPPAARPAARDAEPAPARPEEDAPRAPGDLAAKLAVLGFQGKEAEVYLALWTRGPSRASDLASALGMNRTSAYHVLRQLARRGFVSATFARPSRFTANPLDPLIEAKAQEWRQALERADALRKELAQLAPAAGREAAGAANRFQVVQGRRDTLALAERMLRGAQRDVRAASTHAQVVRIADAAGAWRAFVECAEGRVPLRAVLRPTEEMEAELRQRPGLRPHVRVFETDDLLQFLLVDGRELLLWVALDPQGGPASEHDAAIWTNAPTFVATMATLFDALWAAAERSRRMPPA